MTPTKSRVWNELISQPGRPPIVQKRLFHTLWLHLLDDTEFWRDLLDRHGLRDKSLSDLDPHTRQHAIGNFWGMLWQATWEMKKRERLAKGSPPTHIPK
jgi:hypothetical protein